MADLTTNPVLVYVKPISSLGSGAYKYRLYFSETPEYVWGVDWDVLNPFSNGDMTPEKSTYHQTYTIESKFKLSCLQETKCYSMEYAIYRILALSWIDIEGLEEYPEAGRMTLHFGDSKEKVEDILEKFDIKMEEDAE